METYRLFINGQFEASQSTDTVDVMDPASMQRLAVVPDAGKADVDRAVAAARAAFEGPWREVPARERGRILMRLAETLRGRAEELAILETRNTGKPMVEAESDIEDAATCFEYYGGLARNTARRRDAAPGRRAGAGVARAGGCRGSDHSVELPAAHGRVEDRAGALRRLHGRAETRRGNAATVLAFARELRESRRPARRHQHRDRPRSGDGRGAGRASGCGQDRVHWQRANRAAR